MRKVLGLVFSHRRFGNSEIMVKEIMGSIPDPCQREMIRMTDLRIEPCTACYRCLQPDQGCALKDDFNFVLHKIQEADALVIGVPIYILGPHGYYKMLIDRMLGAEKERQFTKAKPCIIVIPYGIEGWEGYSQAGALVLPRLLGMQLVELWKLRATLPGESVLDPQNVAYAQRLGQEIFSGREYRPGPWDCSYCGSDLLRLLPERRIECPICGAQGVLDEVDRPDFTSTPYYRFSDQDSREHFQWLQDMKHSFWAQKDYLKAVQKRYRELNWWIKPEA